MTSESLQGAGPPAQHPDEPHEGSIASRLNWLRAGVLGANDGIVSTAGIVVGVLRRGRGDLGRRGRHAPIFQAWLRIRNEGKARLVS